MARLVVGVDTTESSTELAAYLAGVVAADDVVYVVNSLPGRDESDAEDARAGEDAMDVVADRVADTGATVETHQLVRGNEPAEDLLAFADDVDADEFVVGIRKHTPVGKVVFGSTAQSLLLSADVPVRCVPLTD